MPRHLQRLDHWQRYLVIGSLLAMGYFVAALVIEHTFDVPPSLSSMVALLMMTPPAYLAHKWVTFESHGTHRRELPRFIFTTFVGAALSWVIPWWTVTQLAYSSVHSYALICIFVPLSNYLLLKGYVFVTRGPRARESGS